MAQKTTITKAEDIDADEMLQDKPAKTLLRAWSKRMAKGSAIIVPVFVGGKWTLQVPRGNKRVLQVPVGQGRN
ncbi:MAG: hypothetical protein ABIJ96_13420 [Elusimicrobiota bacterium]